MMVAVILAALFAVGWLSGREGARGELYSNLDTFVEVLDKVSQNYVEPVDPERLITGAVGGMLKTLDPYSQYLDSKGYGNLQDVTHGSFTGIGIEVSVRDHFPTVISPIEGTPAWEAGLQTGDVIVKVDGKSTTDYSLDEVAQALRGPEGSRVTITVSREGESNERDFHLVRREIVVASVPYALVTPEGVGYVRISRFAEDTGEGLQKAIAKVREKGAKSLVVDLRRNPGGLLEQAVHVVEQFVPKGSGIVSTRGRIKAQDHQYTAANTRPETRWPMVVLVDEGSASASEVVAGALQDLDRALVVGRVTYGKGSVQNVFRLRGGEGAVKLTTALYYTPSGRSIHRDHPNTDEDADAKDDDDDDATPRPVTASDSTHRPVFRTKAGRTVYGGGGITPDVVVAADTLGPVAIEVERRGLMLRFAHRWEAAHPAKGTALPGPEAVWPDLMTFLESEKASSSPDSIVRERDTLVGAARREIARRRGGEIDAVQVSLEHDPDFQKAVDILRRSQRPVDVFAMALAPAGSGNGLKPAAPSKKPAAHNGARRRDS